MAAQEATVSKFKYVFVPCDKSVAPTEHIFDGKTDEELRTKLRNYFHGKAQLTAGQRVDMATSLKAKVEEQSAKQKQNAEQFRNSNKDDNETAKVEELNEDGTPAVEEGEKKEEVEPVNPLKQAEARDALLEGAMDSSSFEIVPVTMPTLQSKFIGTSLYIDDAGRFKDLPLNDRASRISQRDIRGDAFLLSNHDDPALDVWERVDCGLPSYEALHASPPEGTLDTSNQAAMNAAAMASQKNAKLVTVEEAAQVLEAKQNGNTKFVAKDYAAAVEEYSKAIELSSARTDQLANEEDVVKARTASHSNRAQCYLNLGLFRDACGDCHVVLQQDPKNTKAWFRLVKASIGVSEFADAESALDSFKKLGGSEEDVTQLAKELNDTKAASEKKEKKMYKKMFA